MRRLRSFLFRLADLFGRTRRDRDLGAELESHLQLHIDDNLRAGMMPAAARRAALIKLGGVQQTVEGVRDRREFAAFATVAQDVRYATRVLAKRPLLLVTTTISIGIGVGLNIAVYSMLRSVLFDPGMTASAPAELFRLEPGLSYPNYQDLRVTDPFVDLTAMQASTLTWRNGDATTTIGARVVSTNFFDVLGIPALHGRLFESNAAGQPIIDSDVVVISYGFWRRLGGDETVVGRTLYLNGWPYVVAGVLPKGVYSMIGPLLAPSVYVPIGARVNRGLEARNAAQFDLVGRTRGRMTRQQLSAVLRVAAQDLERRFPDDNRGLSRTLSISPFGGVIQRLPPQMARIAFTLAGALYAVVGLVFLIACANVAGLLAARAAERGREISIRTALGATRRRLVQQFLAESLVVGTLGSAAGAVCWLVCTTVLPNTSFVVNLGIELIPAPLSLAYCAALALVVTISCGIAPALIAKPFTLAASLRAPAMGFNLRRWTVGRPLITAQVAICFVLLAGACALLFSLLRQQVADPGFDVAHTASIEMQLPTTRNGRGCVALREAISSLPGVEAVTCGDLPLGLFTFDRVQKPGAPEGGGFAVEVLRVGPHYLSTMKIALVRGRDLTDDDVAARSATPVSVIVNETFVRRYLPTADAIGQRLELSGDSETGRRVRLLEVVGVAKAGSLQLFGGDPVPVLYLPALSTSMLVRVAGAPADSLRALERTVANLEPGAAVTAVPTAARLTAVLLPARVGAAVLSALGAVGLILAMTGLYGIISYAANRRRFEIGIRMALGASWSAIARMILRDAVVVVGAGSIAGAILSFALLRALWPLLAGDQSAMTPLALIAVFVLMLIVGLAASLRPAIRAASVDPTIALRQE